MPEVRGGFGKFNAHLRLTLHRRADIDNFARLRFRIRGALQFHLLTLRNFSHQSNQRPVRIYNESLGLFREFALDAGAGDGYGYAENHALASTTIGVGAGGGPSVH